MRQVGRHADKPQTEEDVEKSIASSAIAKLEYKIQKNMKRMSSESGGNSIRNSVSNDDHSANDDVDDDVSVLTSDMLDSAQENMPTETNLDNTEPIDNDDDDLKQDEEEVFSEHSELKTVRIYSYSLIRDIPLTKFQVLNLTMKRNVHREAVEKLALIKTTLANCNKVAVCKSAQHKLPSGCPTCGVIHMGGKINVTLFVKSVSRETGVSTLIPLVDEMALLQRELVVQEEVVERTTKELNELEAQIFHKTTSAIQAWYSLTCLFSLTYSLTHSLTHSLTYLLTHSLRWCSFLALKRIRRVDAAREHSLFFYRVRKLVRMKRDLDSIRNLKDTDNDLSYLHYRYSDLIDAMNEYIAYRVVHSLGKTDKIAKIFLMKLRKAVTKARQIRANEFREREIIRAANDKRVQKERFRLTHSLTHLLTHLLTHSLRTQKLLKDLRKTVIQMEFEAKRWICNRLECTGKRFFSKDRFAVHMSIHRMKEARNVVNMGEIIKRRDAKAIKEAAFLQRIRLSRDAINSCAIALDESLYCEPSGSGWTSLPHIRSFYSSTHQKMYYIEILSKKDSIVCPSRIPLDKPVVRLGSMRDACGDGTVTLLDNTVEKSNGMISKIHCMFYVPMGAIDESKVQTNQSPITIVDNSSKYGTYVVGEGSESGAMKVPNKLSAGIQLELGNLICIGVKKDGEHLLSPTEASTGCIVFRFCLSMES